MEKIAKPSQKLPKKYINADFESTKHTTNHKIPTSNHSLKLPIQAKITKKNA